MIYQSAIDQVKGMRTEDPVVFRLAEVTSLSNGRAYVKFYGESAASTKLYPYIEGYKPTVGDKVLMIAQSDTFIIAGKISKDNITNNYYLTKGDADATFLTEAQADAKYEPKGEQKDPRRIVSSDASDSAVLFFSSEGTNYPHLIGWRDKSQGTKLDLGRYNSSTARFGGIYCDTLGGTASPYAIQTLNVKDTNTFGNITPNTNKGTDLGTSAKQIGTAYIDIVQGNEQHFESVYFGSGKTRGFIWDSTNNRLNLAATSTFSIGSGTSNQLNNVYAKQFYQNGTAISTSDKRKKTGIKNITKKYIDFFRKLRPVLFRFKDGESGRLHSGFIAQEVEEAAGEAGIDSKDLAFLCIDDKGNYGLRYEELIAVQTQIIQDLLIRVEKLEGSKT